MTRVAPCPQCHGTHCHIAEWYDRQGEIEYYIVCDDCGYEDPDKFDDRNLAKDHWNRRVATGYTEGEDPTHTVYDQLHEENWEPEHAEDVVGAIDWGIPDGMHLVDVDLSHDNYIF